VLVRLGLLVVLATSLFGQSDLSGVWQHAQDGYSATCTIEQQDATVTITRQSKFTGGRLSGGLFGTNRYPADGIERAGKDDGGRETWTTVNWQGLALVALRIVKDGYRVTVTRESWSVSTDGRMLTRSMRTIDMDGVRESVERFDKQ
jgi:hypothetical protein